MEKLEIKVFGETAKNIKEGQHFIASVGSVEGRTVVTLTPTAVIGHIGKNFLENS